MTRFAYNVHRSVAGVFLIAIVFSGANYYLDLGLPGQGAKLVLISILLLFTVYGGFFAPTRQEMRDQREAKRTRKNL
jgi:hypothetical protein